MRCRKHGTLRRDMDRVERTQNGVNMCVESTETQNKAIISGVALFKRAFRPSVTKMRVIR